MTKAEEMAHYDALVAGLPRDSYLSMYLRSADVRASVEWAMKSDSAEPNLHGLNLQVLQRQHELRVLAEKQQKLAGEIAGAEQRLRILAEIANDVEIAGERLAGQARALRQIKNTLLPAAPVLARNTLFQVPASGRS